MMIERHTPMNSKLEEKFYFNYKQIVSIVKSNLKNKDNE